MDRLPDPDRLVILGIDTHAEVHVGAAIDGRGQLLATLPFRPNVSGFSELLEWANGFGTQQRRPRRTGLRRAQLQTHDFAVSLTVDRGRHGRGGPRTPSYTTSLNANQNAFPALMSAVPRVSTTRCCLHMTAMRWVCGRRGTRAVRGHRYISGSTSRSTSDYGPGAALPSRTVSSRSVGGLRDMRSRRMRTVR